MIRYSGVPVLFVVPDAKMNFIAVHTSLFAVRLSVLQQHGFLHLQLTRNNPQT